MALLEIPMKSLSCLFRKRRKKTAAVFGGGGARGWAHVGVLRAFKDLGFKPDIVTGTSIGSIAAAVHATGTEDKVTELATKMDWKNASRLFLELSLKRGGIIEGKKVVELLKEVFGEVKIEDLPLPYAAVAVDLASAEEVVFTSGSLVDAIRASVSIPGIFTPVARGDGFLVDGGLTNPVPIDAARALGAEYIVAVNINNQKEFVPKEGADSEPLGVFRHLADGMAALAKKISGGQDLGMGMLEVYRQAFRVAEDHLSILCVERAKPDMLIEPAVRGVSTMDFTYNEDVVQAGYDAAMESMRGNCGWK